MQYEWEKLTDEQICQMRVRDLKIGTAGGQVEKFVNQLYAELKAKNIEFCPPYYLADEWLCPDKVPIIGIPFCLANNRLKKIEKKIMLEVEGETAKKFMKLLRHECGHAVNYAYQLYKKTRWRQLFGRFSDKYGDSYYYYPYSRKFVIHLENNYAQSHPDDDFAETFAVWLGSDGRWQKKYKNWPVIAKLNYVDRLMKKIGNIAPIVTAKGTRPWSAARMTSTLAGYYERKKKRLGTDFQGYYDDSLKAIFLTQSECHNQRASKIIRENRRQIIDSVTRWVGHRKYDVNRLFNTLVKRCDSLQLCTGENQMHQVITFTALLTAIAAGTHRITAKK